MTNIIEDVVLYDNNQLETPYGTLTCVIDTGNLQIQLEIEKFLKEIKSKYCY